MKFFRFRLLALIFTICCVVPAGFSNTVFPHKTEGVDCPVAPPENLNADIITPTSITLSWTPASGTFPAEYKITFFDQTTQVPLADAYTTLTTHTRTGLTPGHVYQIGVSASDCLGGPYGREATIFVKTSIIILDDIVQNCPLNQGQNYAPGNHLPVELQPAGSPNEDVQFKRFKIQNGNSTAEFLLLAGCDHSPRYSEISLENVYRDPQGDDLETESIQFYFAGGGAFFHLHHAEYGVSAFDKTRVTVSFDHTATLQQCTDEVACPDCCSQGRTAGPGDYDPVLIGAAVSAQGSVPTESVPVSQVSDEQVSGLKVTPNPTHSDFTASYVLPAESAITLTLSDITGRVIKVIESPVVLPAGPHQVNFQTEDLPAGIYMLVLQTNGERRSATWVKL